METVQYIEIPSEEKLIYGNSLIAVFDGYVKNPETQIYEDKSDRKRKSRVLFAYHESWEALMPVLKKIGDVDDVYASGIAAILKKNRFEILPVWGAVVEHVKFVNKKNGKNE